MTTEQCLALVAADTRVREAARDVVKRCDRFPVPRAVEIQVEELRLALAEFDRAMEEQKC